MDKIINDNYLLNYLLNFYQPECKRIHIKKYKNVLQNINYLGNKYNNKNILSNLISDLNLERMQYFTCPPRYRHLGHYKILFLIGNIL